MQAMGAMTAIRHTTTLGSLILEILESTGRRSRKLTVAVVRNQFQRASRLDYARQLRALFDRRQMKELLADFRTALPALNAEIFHIHDPRRLAGVAAELGVRFQAEHFEGEAGKSLRGFYVDDRSISKGPLICVNTANHPVAVASAFWHEVGHHLTSRSFDVSHPSELSFTSSFEDHLENPLEIAADMVSVLAAYPKRAARQLFGEFVKTAKTPDIDALVSRARTHLRTAAGYDFQLGVPPTENLHYLAGMMHFIRLRWVLFSEYDI
jgi:hypothetical protein